MRTDATDPADPAATAVPQADARSRLIETTKRRRAEHGIVVAPQTPQRLGDLAPRDAQGRPLSRQLYRPADEAQPAKREPRPFPISAGECEWAEVHPALREELSAAISARRYPIYLYGPVGTGKTCAAACLYCHWQGSARWYELSTLIGDITACRMGTTGHVLVASTDGRTPVEKSESAIRRDVTTADFVVFNDAGLRQPSAAALEIVFSLIDVRGTNPTIATSNLNPDQLATIYDDRIASRVFRGAIIQVVGDDRRANRSTRHLVRLSGAAK